MSEAGLTAANAVDDVMPASWRRIHLTVNGKDHVRVVEARRTLVDFLREDLMLTGTHSGCEYGVCGACTVTIDGELTRACLVYAAQADGAVINTVESLSAGLADLHPIQQAFWDHHGLQCGFCTPGMVMTCHAMLQRKKGWTESEVREELTGNLCRCTGYQQIVESVMAADEEWER